MSDDKDAMVRRLVARVRELWPDLTDAQRADRLRGLADYVQLHRAKEAGDAEAGGMDGAGEGGGAG